MAKKPVVTKASYGEACEQQLVESLKKLTNVVIPSGAKVTFKCKDYIKEFPIGPIGIWRGGEDSGLKMVPFGEPHPDQIADLGWGFVGGAAMLAERLKLEFEQF